MLRIYSGEHNTNLCLLGLSVCGKKPTIKLKNTMFLLNMVDRKGFAKLMFEQSPKEGKKTNYLKKECFRQRKSKCSGPEVRTCLECVKERDQ